MMLLRHVRRLVRCELGFALLASATLALGIGASTTVFSVVNGVLLAPIRYTDPARVVAVNTKWTDSGRQIPRVAGPDWRDLAAATDVFEGVARYHGGEVGVQLGRSADFAQTTFVNPGFFELFGAAPVRGRLPRRDDEFRAALVSDAFASRALGGAGRALGEHVRVDSQAFEIVGVMPPGFSFPSKTDVWVVYADAPENSSRSAYNYRAIAKLRPGVTLQAAQARIDALAAQLARANLDTNRNKQFALVPVREQMVGNVRPTIVILMAATVLLLLIACANVAHLLLARTVSRQREYAVRAAMGASGVRLFGQSLVESGAIGVAGALGGIVLARAGVSAVVAFAPANLPRLDEVAVDWTVLLFGIGLGLVCALVFGMAPAWQASRVDVQEALKGVARTSVTAGSPRLRNALVVTEIAMAFTLAIGAGLLFRSFLRLNEVELGYRTEGILVTYAHVPANTRPALAESIRFYERLLPELALLPGVRSAAAVMGLPSGRYGSNGKYFIEGREVPLLDAPDAGFRLVSAGYFSTMGIPFVRGRDFSERDQADTPFAAIISESLARQSFPNEDPIGKRIRCGLDAPDKPMTIVGVVGDVRSDSPASRPAPELYMPFQQHPWYANEMQVVVRTAVEPGAMQPAVERKIRTMNPLVATKTMTMRTIVGDSIALPRFRTLLTGCFAGAALLLALAGVYGVTAYAVARRGPELALRSALGAASGSIAGLVLRGAATLAAAGVGIGLVLAAAASRALASMLFGLTPTDAVTYAISAVALAAVAVGAAAVPAWRAAHIDPAVALRQD